MQLLYEVQSVLERAHYQTSRLSAEDRLEFEDESLFGFVMTYDNAADIVHHWEAQQDQFLARYASRLRAVPQKAWNAYCIFLTCEEPTCDIIANLVQIEEDFRGSRKIARAGIANAEDVQNALSPLLPIRNAVTLDSLNSLPRLQKRLLTFLSESECAALSSTTDVIEEGPEKR